MWNCFANRLRWNSRKQRRQKSSSLTHQALESRNLLATFVVNTLSDNVSLVDGLVSLREAVIASNTNSPFGDAGAGDAIGDAIQFDPSLAGGTINLSNGTLNISDDLLIQGGSSGITISTDLEFGLFAENTSERVAFGGLTFANGVADSGGAIKSLGGGTTLVVNSTFQNNRSTGIGGGAIFHDQGRLNVTNTDFASNETSGDGGAILVNGGVMGINGGSFEGNSADRGAAIHFESGTHSVSGTTFGSFNSPNQARLGGVFSIDDTATVVINTSELNWNEATESGGAIWNTSQNNIHVRDSVFSHNSSLGTVETTGGGAIFNEDGSIFIRGSEFDSNNAGHSGGAIMSEDGIAFALNSEFTGNTAVVGGGAVENVDGRFVARSSTLGGNAANVNTAEFGGAIRNSGSGDLVVNNSAIVGNTAFENGGGIWNSETGEVRVINFSGLTANIASGSDAGDGGGAIFNDEGKIYITSSQLTNNVALAGSASGGAILSVDGSVLINNSSLTGNRAALFGGAVDVQDGYFRANGSAFSGNRVGFFDSSAPQKGYGGAIAVTDADAIAVLDSTSLNGNLATEQGGAVWVAEGGNALLLSSTSFTSNETSSFSTSRGGAIYADGRVRGQSFSMTSNSSTSFGGGLYVSSTGSALLESGEFRDNESEDRGGAIFNGNFVNVSNSVFSGNTADDGGAIFTPSGETLIQSGNQFSGNFPNNVNV